ncbi:MAG: sulfotransferase domain-containing protein, partial [Proteobacteria bacterium]|nr:sulfotransferase domain-containing protein [Pseudomonadota bacterium]
NDDQEGGFRAFKSHMSWADVPKGCRYICVIRNPRDSAVSFYRFMEGWIIEPGAISMEDFVCNFYSRRPGGKDYWTHLMSWWAMRDAGNVLLLAFEDIKADHAGTVRRVADFLGLAPGAAALELATEQSTFDFMKRHERQFDDHLVARARNAALDLPMEFGSTKVKSGQVGGHDRGLNEAALAALDQAWVASVEKDLGFASYADLRAAL